MSSTLEYIRPYFKKYLKMALFLCSQMYGKTLNTVPTGNANEVVVPGHPGSQVGSEPARLGASAPHVEAVGGAVQGVTLEYIDASQKLS